MTSIDRTEREAHIAAFLAKAGWGAAQRGLLAGDASFRRYDRLKRDGADRGADGCAAADGECRTLPQCRDACCDGLGFSTPRILAEDRARGLLLLEDLGDDTYTTLLRQGHDERALYELATDALIEVRRRVPANALGDPAGVRRRALPARSLAAAGLVLAGDQGHRRAGRRARASSRRRGAPPCPACGRPARTVALFDFHVDNLLVLPGRSGFQACGLLDFQDAVAGPVPFDLASLLEDVRRQVPQALANAMVERYLKGNPDLKAADFRSAYRGVGGAAQHAHRRHLHPAAEARQQAELSALHAAGVGTAGAGHRASRHGRRCSIGSISHLSPAERRPVIDLKKLSSGISMPNKNSSIKMPKRAMVLAAGFGKRLRPFTDKVPKPLTKVLGVPMIDVVLDRLAAAGVERAVVNLHHLGEQIRTHLKDRKKPEIVFSQEDEILETGGGIVKAMPLLGDEPFFTVNAKIIWLNGKTDCLVRMAQAFDPDKMDALLLLHSDGARRSAMTAPAIS